MYKLFLGNESEDTDQRVSVLADQNNTINHGLISTGDFIPSKDGYYHTSVVDLSQGEIFTMSMQFDEIELLDQPAEEWSHPKVLTGTLRVCQLIKDDNRNVTYRENNNVKHLIERQSILNNPSFCIYPWINLVDQHGDIYLCSRSDVRMYYKDDLSDWTTNPDINYVREKMLKGEKLPNHCQTCYGYEDHGIESYRTYETNDWLALLDINSYDDLKKIDHPYYYEIKVNNKCNLMCRMCTPEYSHKIEKEIKEFDIPIYFHKKYDHTGAQLDRIQIDKLDYRSRVYFSGGEPTIIKEVYQFMEKCIDQGRTDFQMTFGTNGQTFSDKFMELCSHFNNITFAVSLDCYGKINDYWRWGSKWEDIIANMHMAEDQGHLISIQNVPGIYNVTNLHLLYEFLDKEFPMVNIYTQLNYERIQSAFNHPRADLVVKSMEKCMQTNMYYCDGKSTKTAIDSLHKHYLNNPGFNKEDLKQFFIHSDALDAARGCKLGDVIPELEACRKFI